MATATDICQDDVTVSYTDSALDETDPCDRVITRTWTADDGCTTPVSCTQLIHIVDTTQPEIDCPPDATIECDGSATYDPDPADTGQARAIDICQLDVTVSYTDSALDETDPCDKVITRTWTADDGCTTPVSCTQLIHIIDTRPPEIDCPPEATIECDGSATYDPDPAVTGMATAIDVCQDDVTVSYTDMPMDDTDPCDMTITRVWTADDGCTTPVSCTQLIRIVDTTQPEIECPPDATIECDGSTAYDPDPADTGMATATDICQDDVTVSYSDSPMDRTDPCDMTITRTWTADDGCTTPVSCTQVIHVVDTTPPECVGNDITVALGPDLTYCLTPSDIAALTEGSDDICQDEVTVVSVVPDCFDCDTLGPNTVEITVTDGCNTSTCTATVTVLDLVTVNVGNGYTIKYPEVDPAANSGMGEELGVEPWLLAGPGNWVTVEIEVCNCGPLTQLVFELEWDCSWLTFMDQCPLYWNMDKVRVPGPFAVPDWVKVDYGVSPDNPQVGRLVVWIDSPSGETVIEGDGGCDRLVSLMFKVADDATGFAQCELTPTVLYATGMNGLEVAADASPGMVWKDDCNWLLDMDKNGRVEADTDGVLLYRALKYGHLSTTGPVPSPLVPIVPPEDRDACGYYLPPDSAIVAYAQWMLSEFGAQMDFDGFTDPNWLVAAAPFPIGYPEVKASLEGVYAYRNLAVFLLHRYPYYMPPAPYNPYISPMTPDMATHGMGNQTVPSGHDQSTANEDTINEAIDLFKILWCPWIDPIGGGPVLPLAPSPMIPTVWSAGPVQLPLPGTVGTPP
jgi:hypothetical protein